MRIVECDVILVVLRRPVFMVVQTNYLPTNPPHPPSVQVVVGWRVLCLGGILPPMTDWNAGAKVVKPDAFKAFGTQDQKSLLLLLLCYSCCCRPSHRCWIRRIRRNHRGVLAPSSQNHPSFSSL
ncbi:hypothetical protein Mapa_006535 [Marchantia paleacea]|nr:hypothetical protein Mapa_006535 [Marchantia paleacea]